MFRENSNKIPKNKIGALVIHGAKLLIQPGKVFDYLEVQLPVEDNLPNVKGEIRRHWGPEWMPMKIKSRIKLSEAKWWRVGNFVLSVNIFTCTNEPIRAQQRWLKVRGVSGWFCRGNADPWGWVKDPSRRNLPVSYKSSLVFQMFFSSPTVSWFLCIQ